VTAQTTQTSKNHSPATPSHSTTISVVDTSTPQKTLNHTRHHTTQSSKTLMRRAVKKPHPKAQLTVHPALAKAGVTTIQPKNHVQNTDPARLERAQATPQSPHVSRYAQHKDGYTVSYGSIPVQPEPKQLENEAPVAPPPLQTVSPTAMFENAIHQATHYVDIVAERTHFNRKKRTHALHMAGGLTALAVLTGFAVFLNSPSLQIRLAGLKTGLAQSTPDLSATGFGFGGVQTGSDARVLGLTDSEGNYQLRQTPTNWSGPAMIRSVSSTDASGKHNYETLNFAGYSVYRLTNGTYTWVKDGIWYQFTPTDGNKEVPLDKLSALIQNS